MRVEKDFKKKRIVIFASGRGSNTERIIDYFRNHKSIEVSLIVTNKADAGVVQVAKRNNIPSLLINRTDFYESDKIVTALKKNETDLIVLAGFLWLIPGNLIKAFANKIINIHPALLPFYGGKGMYGNKVHQAILDKKEKESGISIHYVNSKYDEGKIILQEKCSVEENDTCETLAQKIQRLEHEHFPRVIEKLLTSEQ